jgi:hypothetical protein
VAVSSLGTTGIERFAVAGTNEVRIYRRFSASASLTLDTVLPAPANSDGFGVALAFAGDTDGDGLNELFVGAPGATNPSQVKSGAVYRFNVENGSFAVLWGSQPNERFGASLANAGDTDGDLIDDLLVGGFLNAGSGVVRLYSGGNLSLRGSLAGSGEFGFALAGVGDVDGDYLSDFVVSVPLAGASAPGAAPGEVRLYSGLSLQQLAVFQGSNPGRRFGHAVAAAGDWDGNGTPDVVIGEPGPALSLQFQNSVTIGGVPVVTFGPGGVPGAAYVVACPTGATLSTMTGPAGSQFGFAVAGGADLDGDGRPDVAVGAPGFDDPNQNDLGRVFSYHNPSASPSTVYQLPIPIGGGQVGYGYSVLLGTESNLKFNGVGLAADGLADIIAGAPVADFGASLDAGSATLVNGTPNGPGPLSIGEPIPVIGSGIARLTANLTSPSPASTVINLQVQGGPPSTSVFLAISNYLASSPFPGGKVKIDMMPMAAGVWTIIVPLTTDNQGIANWSSPALPVPQAGYFVAQAVVQSIAVPSQAGTTNAVFVDI